MITPRGIVICVGFDDLLSITLPLNIRFMADCLVVTAPDDARTKAVCAGIDRVSVLETDAFTRHGARFNKGLAMEEAFDHLSREGWLLVLDSDVLMPFYADLSRARPDCLNGCNRVFLDDPKAWTPDLDWRRMRPYPEPPGLGYFQLFRADAVRIKDKRPWYDTTFAHAGSCDAHFVELWEPRLLHRLPFTCLHIGPSATNWFGRTSPRLDGEPVADQVTHAKMMARYLKWSEWGPSWEGLKVPIDDQPLINRVHIDGQPPSAYEAPHIRQKGQRIKRGFFH